MAKTIWGGKKITEIIKDAENKQNNLNSLFNKLQETAVNIDGIAKKVNEKLQSVSLEAGEVSNVLNEVKEAKQETQQFREEISNLKTATDELVSTNQSLVKEIKDQLAVVAGASLSNTFEGRRSVLRGAASKWFWWLFGDICVLVLIVVAAIILFELKGGQNITTGFFLRFSLSFPFIYAAIFFHGQYNKERELEEEYAFKSAVSFSLEAYRKLLNEEIDDAKPGERLYLLEFITNSVEKLYSPPRKDFHIKKGDNESSSVLNEVKAIIESIASLVKRP